MEKQDRYAAELQLLADEVDSGKNSQISSILKANLGGRQHIMLIEEKSLKSGYQHQPMKDFFLLEKVDLSDFWRICEKNGRKTR